MPVPSPKHEQLRFSSWVETTESIMLWNQSLSHTLHGTGIYAAPLTPGQPPQRMQCYASPMGRVWVHGSARRFLFQV